MFECVGVVLNVLEIVDDSVFEWVGVVDNVELSVLEWVGVVDSVLEPDKVGVDDKVLETVLDSVLE